MKLKNLLDLSDIKKGIGAGAAISLASYCFLLSPHKEVGAVLFSVGLIIVCDFGLNLFTGKAAYVGKSEVPAEKFLIMILLNTAAAAGCGFAASRVSAVSEAAKKVCDGKFAHGHLYLLISAMACGALIFIAVDIYRSKKKYIGIIFAIPVFILCGFDHSVADTFYIFASGKALGIRDLINWTVITLGNFLGSKCTRWLFVCRNDMQK